MAIIINQSARRYQHATGLKLLDNPMPALIPQDNNINNKTVTILPYVAVQEDNLDSPDFVRPG